MQLLLNIRLNLNVLIFIDTSHMFIFVSRLNWFQKLLVEEKHITSLPNLFLDQFLTFNLKWPISGLECEWYMIWITLRTLKTSGITIAIHLSIAQPQKSWQTQTNLYNNNLINNDLYSYKYNKLISKNTDFFFFFNVKCLKWILTIFDK